MKLMPAAIILAIAALPARAADTALLDRHVAAMKAGDTAAVLADYAPDAVVVTPPGMVSKSGVFVGGETKRLFSVLTDKDHVPGNKTMTTRYEAAGPGTTIMHWVQFDGSAQRVSGEDVFVVRGGKVVFQTVSVDRK